MIISFKHKGLVEFFERGHNGKMVMHSGSILSNIIEVTMAEYSVKRPLKRAPVHPGEILREDVLPSLELSVSEAARRLGVSRQQLHRILACTHPITIEMALRIGKLVGNGPGLWLRLQQACDLWRVEQSLKDELAEIRPANLTHSPGLSITMWFGQWIENRCDKSLNSGRLP